MFRSRLRLTLSVLAVSLILTAPLHGAASRGSAPGRASRTSLAASRLPDVWDWLTALWAKAGCGLDPSGLCTPAANPPAASSTDAGCGIDPGGRTCVGHS